jgi:tRNA 2-selenouridine synthase SelU
MKGEYNIMPGQKALALEFAGHISALHQCGIITNEQRQELITILKNGMGGEPMAKILNSRLVSLLEQAETQTQARVIMQAMETLNNNGGINNKHENN